MNRAVEVLSTKIDTLTCKSDDNHTAILQDIAHIRENVIKGLIESNKCMSSKLSLMDDRVVKLEAEVAANKGLCSKICLMEEKKIHLEKDVNVATNRMRENNIELSSIPNSVEDANLLSKAIDICSQIGVVLKDDDIQGIHRLPLRRGSSYKPVIVKFVNRRSVGDIMARKKKLSNLKLADLGFPADTQIFAIFEFVAGV